MSNPKDPRQLLLYTRASTTRFWRQLRALFRISRSIYPVSRNKWFVKRVKYLWRALTHLGIASHWNDMLATAPFSTLADYHPRLHEKPLRPYLHVRLTRLERYRILREHYLFLRQQVSAQLFTALVHGQAYALVQRATAHLEEPFTVSIAYAGNMEREGELTLSVESPAYGKVATLTFVVHFGMTGWEILIGGLQGGQAGSGREAAKRVTKAFHGMRPKPLLIHLLQEIAACWGISGILAISDAAHILKRRRYRYRSPIKSSYDLVWAEAKGHPAERGFFAIPVGRSRRDINSVPSHKRAVYLRRFQLQDDMDAELRQRLRSPAFKLVTEIHAA